MEELRQKAIESLEKLGFALTMDFEVTEGKLVDDFIEVLKGMDL